MRPPTLRDVAEAASVHVATASRALNPDTRSLVSSTTAERVLQAAKALDYRPNPIARSLRTARTDTVGLVIPDLTNPLVPPMVRGVADVLDPGRLRRLDRQHRQRPGPGDRPDRVAAGQAGRRPHRRDRPPRAPLAGAVARRGRAHRAGQPSPRRRPHPVGHRRQRRRQRAGRRAPGRPRPPPDRARVRPADPLHRAGPPPRLPAGDPRPRAAGGPRAAGHLRGLDRAGGRARASASCSTAACEFTAVVAGHDRVALGCLRRTDRAGAVLSRGRQRRRVQRHALHGQDAARR